MSAPHIVVINVHFAPYTYGGATIVAEQVAHALRQRHGYRITAISAISRSDLHPYSVIKVEKNGVANYLINLPYGRTYAETYDNPQVTQAVSDLLEMLVPDMVHIHCIQDIGAGVIGAAKRQGLPVVLSTHDFWWICERQFMIRTEGTYCSQDPVQIGNCRGCVDNHNQARTRQEVLYAAAAQADIITHPSHFARDLNERSGLTARKSIVWTNGIRLPSPGFFNQQATRRKGAERLSFGFIGGPSQIKGWPIIRKAFAGLERDDFDVHLVEGSLDESWWKGLDTNSLPGHWKVWPRFEQAKMDDLFSNIDVLLYPSQWRETFGLSIREAIARGIRVIQTDSGGTTEHPLAYRERMLQIGDGPEVLRNELERVLDRSTEHPDPVEVTSFNDQAAEIAEVFHVHLGVS
ncbi:MAG: glycosyltransferase family 4 protein [Rhodobacteraceae bacterium]|nr:glycosyltransferase family 4 protein [Paracoccaceae bacterium]